MIPVVPPLPPRPVFVVGTPKKVLSHEVTFVSEYTNFFSSPHGLIV